MNALRLGILSALATLVLDQASKTAVLSWSESWGSPIRTITPFLDFVQLWNYGISYGLFQQGDTGRWVLVAIKVGASIGFAIWLARTSRRLEALALGLLIGGALGNAVDRVAYGAVFDFVSLHAFEYRWYVFNVADIAVVVGVMLLLYDALFARASKTPPSEASGRARSSGGGPGGEGKPSA
ncbi:lipoprotein signal peptidase [Azorhizobium oxalatiphilum]|uniref:Lipoprotein signal peptidase n=1 Tax=Azorhizobium oxalatiphilum TaxID=980631 RepID=A0A917CHW8_9HYPH|nr:signal peptidase II [Azorhizobium oxalatiphilum]GGF89071.1 lipoprotein signal peptidase [Azorhizobium oxalatiphilum]